ncbi:parB-like partition protein [Clostridium sp. CAG:1024]|nr:parB-like partition protein [Clostridium sp. CAG:1024]
MKSNGKKLSLTSYDDIFTTEDARQEDQRGRVVEIPLGKLQHFHDHPFQVRHDQALQDMADSIKEYGVLSPALARPLPDGGGYEVISGNRRLEACILAGMQTMPVIVRDMTDDEAIIAMVDANLQRENILPSERAYAYKMKLEAIKRQGFRADLTSGQVVQKSKTSVERVAEQAGESYKQVQRYIRLTELIPPILDMVDGVTEQKIAFNPAVELSYLTLSEQTMLLDAMAAQEATPSLSQAQRLKKFSQQGKLSEDVMMAIMSEEKKEVDRITLTTTTLSKYFPKSYTPKKMEETIIKLLEQWQRKRQHEQER